MRKFLLLLCVCGCFAGTPLLADTFGVNFANTAGLTLGNPPFTEGWTFTVNQTITVTDLAVFDSGGAALIDSHAVGIWNSVGALLVSTTIDAGNVDTLETDSLGQTWRDKAASVTLTPGTYTIGAVWATGNDPMIFPGQLGSITTGGAITFGQGAFIAGSTLTDPTNLNGDHASYFGANFEYNAAAVPEPSSLALIGIGAIGIGLARWRKSK
ncbi:MAG TPA: PEP-CTERM sorting domain-containing protein [Bryobacteraceae bacterium]|nr:PEP-CTERM sorting domain-containing protein [Bryobacteraceae bacterium]